VSGSSTVATCAGGGHGDPRRREHRHPQPVLADDCYMLALDGDKQPVRSVTSNAAHALVCGIAEPAHAARLATRLMADEMFTGWASARSPRSRPPATR
jgi:hypothetical protein